MNGKVWIRATHLEQDRIRLDRHQDEIYRSYTRLARRLEVLQVLKLMYCSLADEFVLKAWLDHLTRKIVDVEYIKMA